MKFLTAYYAGNKFTPTLWEYDEIAMNIVNGKGFLYIWDLGPIKHFNIHFRSILEPFFIMICALTYYFTNHSIFTVLIFQILYASFIPIVIYFMVYRIYDVDTAMLASILSVFVPGIILYSATKLHYMPLYALFLCLLILLSLRLYENFSFKNQILLGVLLGVSFLLRSETIFVMAVIVPWLLLSLKVEIKKKMLVVSKVLMIAAVVISPWVLRNCLVYKRFVLLHSADGCFLYMATNPNATGTLYLPDGRFQLEGIPKELLSKYDTLTEMQFRDLMMAKSWGFIKENPIRILKLFILRFYYFWWFSPITGKAPGHGYPGFYLKLYNIYYLAVLLIFVYQAFLTIRRALEKKDPAFTKEVLILAVLLAVSIPHAILYAEGRHRFAIEPLLLIFVSRRIMLWIKTEKYSW